MNQGPGFLRFLKHLSAALAARIGRDWASTRDAALHDGQQFLEESRDDLARWTGLLAAGALTRTDFEWLVDARRDLARVEALGKAGLPAAGIDKFRSMLAETIVTATIAWFI